MFLLFVSYALLWTWSRVLGYLSVSLCSKRQYIPHSCFYVLPFFLMAFLFLRGLGFFHCVLSIIFNRRLGLGIATLKDT